MKLFYTLAFALFPLTAPAQAPDASLLTALCHDDYFEDTAGHCRSVARGEDLTIEAILAHYGEIISSDADDESVFYFTDPEDAPVGAIQPRQITPSDDAIARDDDEDRTADLTNTENTVAAQIITSEPLHEEDEHAVADSDADVVAMNGPSQAGVAANTSILTGEEPTVE
jgi:hypothetical protein